MDETRRRIDSDPDYVQLPRYGCSLAKTVAANPEGVGEDVVQKALQLSEADMARVTQEAVDFLRGEKPECKWCGKDRAVPGYCSEKCRRADHAESS